VAALLNKERHAVQSLSAAQCQNIIGIFRKIQQDRDAEIMQLLKPFTDCLDNLIPRMAFWVGLCDGAAAELLQPHTELFHTLDSLVNTPEGMKPGSYFLEGDVLLAIEASNKILRALAIEKKYLGLSTPMAQLKSNVKKMMGAILELLEKINKLRTPIPGVRFFPTLDATKGQVVLRKGYPFYVDPNDDNLVVCPPKHPLVKAPGSEWNKWFQIPPVPTISNCKHVVRIHVQTEAFRHLRHMFQTARFIEFDNQLLQPNNTGTVGDPEEGDQVCIKRMFKTCKTV
jgi:hypothetical protein